MHQRISYIILLLCFAIPLRAQVVAAKLSTSDLANARKIYINKTYSFLESPVGFGNVKEFTINPRRNPTQFREERNSMWFEIGIPFDGELTFVIKPHNIYDDYDWMLFQYDNNFKSQLQNDATKPLRTNNARNDKRIGSLTGIKTGAAGLFETPGPGESFSAPLQVKKGEKLALLVDNIYDGGSGFDIEIKLQPREVVTLSGTVKAKKSGIPLAAEVIAEDDSTGTYIFKAVTDPITGAYSLQVPLNLSVNITASNPNYLFATADLVPDKPVISDVDFLLDTIETGNKLIMFNIHFAANKDEILPSSMPDLERLTAFLKEHSEWTVKIIGHTNNNVFAEPRYLQKLSFERAISVKKYLLKNSIPEKRLSCGGMGGKSPILNTKDPVLAMRNLRVEVVLLGK